jgi:hypothetical protein
MPVSVDQPGHQPDIPPGQMIEEKMKSLFFAALASLTLSVAVVPAYAHDFPTVAALPMTLARPTGSKLVPTATELSRQLTGMTARVRRGGWRNAISSSGNGLYHTRDKGRQAWPGWDRACR